MAQTLFDRYVREISQQFDWEQLRAEAADNGAVVDGERVGMAYLGSVLSLTPSGKYYTSFANSNVTEAEADDDQAWFDALDDVAQQNGMWVESGEGDPTDVFVLMRLPE